MATRTRAGTARRRPAAAESATAAPRTGAKRTVMYYVRQLPQYLRLLGGLITDPRVALVDKLLVAGAMAYIVMPIDLIPDFIPVFGYLDDLLIVPLGIAVAVRLVPAGLMAEFRTAAAARAERPVNRAMAVAFVAIWVVAAALVAWLAWRRFA